MTGYSDPNDDPGDRSWHRYELDPEERPSEGLIVAASSVTNSPPTEMEALYEVIDPDALDALFASDRDASYILSSFEYAGCEVEVSNPYIRIRESS